MAQSNVTVVPAGTSPESGSAVTGGTKVSLLCDITDAEIYYTTDKTLPTAQSRLYSTPITIVNDVTIKAVLSCHFGSCAVSARCYVRDFCVV